MKYAFFPGCTMAYRLPFAEKSIRMVAPRLGVELVDLPFTCCPEPNGVRSFSDETWLVFAARNIALAEEGKLDILTACAGCHESLTMAKHEIDTKPSRREVVNQKLADIGMEYKGSSSIVHLHQLLHDKIGTEEIEKKVVRQIPMRVVTHSGCHLLRPEEVLQVDCAEAPVKLDNLVESLGIESLEYMDKTMCCGAGVRGQAAETSFAVLKEKLTSMMMVNPDAAVVFCPTCFISFESGQRIVNRTFGTDFNLPVYYYTELLAVAMDLSGVEIILAGHRVKPDIPLLDKAAQETETPSAS
ncbi:MAG: CoB--CoM heterodisulfide reductase subunit B [Candidatus Thorarchaeota archaeon]|nr:MAG: CoB--CoM heterodisulfide reductase subunit B [Candidatus Thorarchaeota archaeon]